MDKLSLITDEVNTYEVRGILRYGTENFGSGAKSSNKLSACNFTALAMSSRCLHINMQGAEHNQLKKK
jgi:hypothetical protein